jgi:hypothetical protein
MTLTKESQVLIIICLLDLLSTLTLLSNGSAWEGNPLMAFYLRFGVWAFVLMKLLLIFLPIFVMEFSMRYRPRFVKLMLRTAIAAYVGSYLILFVSVNVIANSNTTQTAQAPRPGVVVAQSHR